MQNSDHNEAVLECRCDDPQCAKCLLVNCKDEKCAIHPEEAKRQFRIKYANRS